MAVIGTSKWVCPSCTYHNWLSATKCTLCHCPKQPENTHKTSSPKLGPHIHAAVTIAWPKPAMSAGGASIYTGPHIISPDTHYTGPTTPPLSATDTESNYREHQSSGIRGVEASLRKWICQSCTYSNWPNTNRCIMCRTLRGTFRVHGTSGQSSNEASRYISRADSILDYASYVGAVGGAAHVSSEENLLSVHGQDSPFHPARVKDGRNGNKVASNLENRAIKKWKCHRCTYENWPRASKCIMCQGPKRRTPSPPLSQLRLCKAAPCPPHSPLPDTLPHSTSSPLYLSTHHDNDNALHSSRFRTSTNSNEATATLSLDVPPSPRSSSPTTSASSRRLLISCTDDATPSPEILASARLKSGSDEVRQIRNRLSTSDWLFLNACLGVVNDDEAAVKAYLRQGGDRARQLSKDECTVLGEASKFTVGSTLVHLAIRYERQCLFPNSVLLPNLQS